MSLYDNRPVRFRGSTNIRLVQLLSNSSSDVEPMISCRLRVVALDKAPTYTALSYVWGSSTNTKNITLDGRPFPVRHNLWNFLQQ
jgi:hypothetical protein